MDEKVKLKQSKTCLTKGYLNWKLQSWKLLARKHRIVKSFQLLFAAVTQSSLLTASDSAADEDKERIKLTSFLNDEKNDVKKLQQLLNPKLNQTWIGLCN